MKLLKNKKGSADHGWLVFFPKGKKGIDYAYLLAIATGIAIMYMYFQLNAIHSLFEQEEVGRPSYELVRAHEGAQLAQVYLDLAALWAGYLAIETLAARGGFGENMDCGSSGIPLGALALQVARLNKENTTTLCVDTVQLRENFAYHYGRTMDDFIMNYNREAQTPLELPAANYELVLSSGQKTKIQGIALQPARWPVRKPGVKYEPTTTRILGVEVGFPDVSLFPVSVSYVRKQESYEEGVRMGYYWFKPSFETTLDYTMLVFDEVLADAQALLKACHGMNTTEVRTCFEQNKPATWIVGFSLKHAIVAATLPPTPLARDNPHMVFALHQQNITTTDLASLQTALS